MQFGPLGSVFDTNRRSWGKILGGRADFDEMVAAALESTGSLTGIPPVQLVITLSYWLDVAQGEENPRGLGEFLRNSAFRRKPKKKAKGR